MMCSVAYWMTFFNAKASPGMQSNIGFAAMAMLLTFVSKPFYLWTTKRLFLKPAGGLKRWTELHSVWT